MRFEGTAAYVEGCLNVLAEFGLLDRTWPENRVLYVKEDSRDGSGHLQVGHPSPLTGIFEACVALGQSVSQGDRLGTVTDVGGSHSADIAANTSGIVIMLPGLPRVVKDQATAMIVEV